MKTIFPTHLETGSTLPSKYYISRLTWPVAFMLKFPYTKLLLHQVLKNSISNALPDDGCFHLHTSCRFSAARHNFSQVDIFIHMPIFPPMYFLLPFHYSHKNYNKFITPLHFFVCMYHVQLEVFQREENWWAILLYYLWNSPKLYLCSFLIIPPKKETYALTKTYSCFNFIFTGMFTLFWSFIRLYTQKTFANTLSRWFWYDFIDVCMLS